MADEQPIGPGLGPGGNPEFLPQEPGGQLHGTGAPPEEATPRTPRSRTRPRVTKPRVAAAAGAAVATGSLFDSVSGTINSTVDFLKFIAWIFHPRNILRAVEFVVGIVLMVFGFHAGLQARGERLEGFTTSEGALTRSGLGRVATELGRAARGGTRPRRPASAPHATRRRALAQRYTREERVRTRERKGEKPAGHAKRTKGSGAGTRKAPR